MNLIFLDIDGVLNPECHPVQSTLHEGFQFYPNGIKRLQEILTLTSSKIIISSTWRLGETLETLKTNVFKHYNLTHDIIGITPFINWDSDRGSEINQFINQYNGTIDKFIILDDDDDMGELINHLFKINPEEGITEKAKNDILNFFNEK